MLQCLIFDGRKLQFRHLLPTATYLKATCDLPSAYISWNSLESGLLGRVRSHQGQGGRVMKSEVLATMLLLEAESNGMCAAPIKRSHKRALRKMMETGQVISPMRGIYVRRSCWERLDARDRALYQMKVLAELHQDWVFAGAYAGLAYGLWVSYDQLAKPVIATTRTAHSRRSSDVDRIVVTDDNSECCNNIRVTSFMRTVYDCIRTSGFGRGLAIADSAAKLKAMSGERLADCIKEACGQRSWSNKVCEVARLADGRSDNGGESIARAAMIHLGFEAPDLQRKIWDTVERGRWYRVDFAWDLPDGTMLIGELDGRDKYVDPEMTGGADSLEVLLAERRREAHLTVGKQPVRVMRFSFAEACDLEGFERLLRTYGVPKAERYEDAAARWP